MIHRQESHSMCPGWFYAYCDCGVCGPIRSRRADALADSNAHAAVCSIGGKR